MKLPKLGRKVKPQDLHERFEQIAATLDHFDLQRIDADEIRIDEASILAELEGEAGEELFLGYYSREGLRTAFREYGVLAKLEALGFSNVRFWLDTRDPFHHHLRMYDGEERDDRLLGECLARLANFTCRPTFPSSWAGVGKTFRMVLIDWLMLRNPRLAFSTTRPRLPGQEYPGLGIGEDVMEMLIQMVKRLGLAGLMNFPQHYHNAFLYARDFRYFAPETQGAVMAVARDTEGYTLGQISWAIDWECLIDVNRGAPAPWTRFRGEQILAMDPLLRGYFEDDAYWRVATRAAEANRFRIDREAYARALDRRRREGDAAGIEPIDGA